MLPNRHPADQLADLRGQIKALKQQEKLLRDQFATGSLSCSGQTHAVEIRVSNSRVFMHDKLPEHILNDPQFWRTRTVKTVVSRVRPEQSVAVQPFRAVHPGDPVARPSPPCAVTHETDDEFEVIERFEPRVV